MEMAMKRFTEAGRRALADKNWYSGLTLALMIPEICASLEDPGPGKSRQRYVAWCRKWLEPKFTAEIGPERVVKVLLSAEDCYQARCSIIHSGTAEIEASRRQSLDRLEFFESGGHRNLVAGGTHNGVAQPNYLQLRVDLFSEDVFAAAEEWDESVTENAKVQAEKAKLLVIHGPGTSLGGIYW